MVLGATVNQRNEYDITPPLIATAHVGGLDVVQALLKLGASIESTEEGGDTVQLEIARSGRYLTAQFMLVHGDANVNVVNNGGWSMWDLVIKHYQTPEESRATRRH